MTEFFRTTSVSKRKVALKSLKRSLATSLIMTLFVIGPYYYFYHSVDNELYTSNLSQILNIFSNFTMFFIGLFILLSLFSLLDFPGELKLARQDNEKRTAEAKERHLECLRIKIRDSDYQDRPYLYDIGHHANETLAMRYGIANVKAPSDSSGQSTRLNENRTIRLRKISKIKKDVYEVELVDFRNRTAHAVIEPGTEYVKTFLPKEEGSWFKKFGAYEEALKGNPTFSLIEIAKFYIEKAT